jgi:hypothetical protein
MNMLRQSTAFERTIGPVLDANGAEFTGLLIGELNIKKEGGGVAAMASPATLTHTGNGLYTLVGTNDNSDTVGSLEISVNKSTYQMGIQRFNVVEEAVYDRLFALNAAGFNTTAPDNAGIGNALMQATNAATSAASADSKLSTGRLSRIDRMPDVNAGASGGLSLVGSAMTLDSATLTALFADADVAGLIASITALFDEATDLPVQTLAAQAATATVTALLANGSIATLIADAAAGKVAAEAVSARATESRLAKLDRNLAAVADVQVMVTPTINPTVLSTGSVDSIRDGLALKTDVDAAADAIIDHGDGAGAWGAVGEGGSGSGLTGDYVYTVTVQDASNDAPIENARVRVFRTGKDGTEPTDEDGVAELPIDAATYKVVIAADNYQTLIVDRTFTDDFEETLQLTARSIPPSSIDNAWNIAVDVITQHGARPDGAMVWAVPAEALPRAFASLVVTDDEKFETVDGRAEMPLLKSKAMIIHVEFNGVVKKLPFTATADGQVATISF